MRLLIMRTTTATQTHTHAYTQIRHMVVALFAVPRLFFFDDYTASAVFLSLFEENSLHALYMQQ